MLNFLTLAAEIDPTQLGGWAGAIGIGLWFLKVYVGPAIERTSNSSVKRDEALIETMQQIRDGTIGTSAIVARIDSRLEAHTARDAAAQDQILAEIRMGADHKKP